MPSVILRIVLFANLLLLAMPAEASWRDVNCGFLLGGKEYLTAGSLNATNLRESQQEYVEDAEDYNSGLDMGDLLSCLVSSAEISGGSHMTSAGLATSAAGLVVAPATAGATTTVSAGGVAVAAGGMAIRAHGVAMASQMLMNSGRGRGKMPTGTTAPSSTIWKGKDGSMLHVENPGNRKGEIHLHSNGKKYRYNLEDGCFYEQNKKTNEYDILAPRVIQKFKDDERFKKAIDKGKRYLGED